MIDRRSLLGGIALAPLAGCAAHRPTLPDSNAPDRADAIVAEIRPPRIGPGRTRVTDHGATSGFARDARPAIRAAIASLGAAGGRVTLPAGEWRSDGPIHLTSRVELHLESGATLRFSADPAHYLPVVFTRWEGTECYNHSPPIYAHGATDIALTGKGVIDGQGFAGFFRWRARQSADQQALRRMGAEGVPVADRIFGAGHYLRPSFVQFVDCRRVLVEGLTLRDSTFWMVHPVYCEQVIVRDLLLESAHLNSDGVDPDSCTGVLVERCRFAVGDDGVAIKAGRDRDGWRVGRPSSRIVVRDCVYSGTAGGGMSIGSEMSGGVHDVHVRGLRMGDVVHGLYFKSNLDRGGYIRDIDIRDVTIGSAQSAVIFTTDYHGYRGGNAPTRFSDIAIADVRCGDAIVGLSMVGAAAAPLERIRLSNVAIASARVPLRARNARGMVFDAVRVGGQALRAVADTGPETFGDQLKS
jgi:polygalacturonase